MAANTVSGHSLPYNLSQLMNTNMNDELIKKQYDMVFVNFITLPEHPLRTPTEKYR
jgi:hypothetical protein